MHQNKDSRRYQLGLLNYELGLASPHKHNVQFAFRRALERLSDISGDSVYLEVRSGADCVYLEIVHGTSPKGAVVTKVGTRSPLGLGCGGIAMLAHLEDREVDEVLKINAGYINIHPRLTFSRLKMSVQQARDRGYAITRDRAFLGSGGIAIALPGNSERPPVAVALAALSARLTQARASELYALLKRELRSELIQSN